MEARIETLNAKKLVGVKQSMSFANNTTALLWKSFMPRRKEIENTINQDLISLQMYTATHFSDFKPETQFVKWAAVEVSDDQTIPEGMESFTLPGGLYAVFDYKGSSNDASIFQYIFQTWLPKSGYTLDHRPHFEVLGPKYKNGAPDSEEEIWIPIKQRY